MSERGWQAFLADERTGDWVVLHGGATAVYVVSSAVAAARLAAEIAELPGFDDSGALMTITGGQLSVRLTRGVFRLESDHAGWAEQISAIARAHGAVADRGRPQEVQLAIAARPDDIDVAFWRAVLGYAAMDDDNAVDPLGHSSTVWLQDLDPAK